MTVGVPLAALFSIAHCSLAASISRRLLIQALDRAALRAWMKFGTAIAANRPMIATTIMISTSVKPSMLLRIFILVLLIYPKESGRFKEILEAFLERIMRTNIAAWFSL